MGVSFVIWLAQTCPTHSRMYLFVCLIMRRTVSTQAQETLRLQQIKMLQQSLRSKLNLSPFETEGHVLIGALNGLRRRDYSDGVWFIETDERYVCMHVHVCVHKGDLNDL